MRSESSIEIRRSPFKRNIRLLLLGLIVWKLWGFVSLVGGRKHDTIPPLSEAAYDFLVAAGVGIIIGVFIVKNYLEIQRYQSLTIKISPKSISLFWVSFILIFAVPEGIVGIGCFWFFLEDIYECLYLSNVVAIAGFGLGCGILGWVHNWTSSIERKSGGTLIMEVTTFRSKAKETRQIIIIGLVFLFVAFFIFYKIFTMK